MDSEEKKLFLDLGNRFGNLETGQENICQDLKEIKDKLDNTATPEDITDAIIDHEDTYHDFEKNIGRAVVRVVKSNKLQKALIIVLIVVIGYFGINLYLVGV